MTKDDIITLPNQHLRQKSAKVGIITDDIKKVVQEMEAATIDWEASRAHEVGVALAAVQIDSLLKIVVLRNNYDNKEDHTFTTFINPEITKLYGEIIEDYEGCLSVKDVYGKVPRYSKVKVKAIGLDGKELRVTAEGFLARIFQHEIDHTNGIVFVDHIKDDIAAFYTLKDDGGLEELEYDTHIKDNADLWA
ncbi:peptide deformylase [Aeromicrobium sp.]|nr:peptide deformylase [Candidatus Saccharibacteria bacterium]